MAIKFNNKNKNIIYLYNLDIINKT
jgi:hypothetical protein